MCADGVCNGTGDKFVYCSVGNEKLWKLLTCLKKEIRIEISKMRSSNKCVR